MLSWKSMKITQFFPAIFWPVWNLCVSNKFLMYCWNLTIKSLKTSQKFHLKCNFVIEISSLKLKKRTIRGAAAPLDPLRYAYWSLPKLEPPEPESWLRRCSNSPSCWIFKILIGQYFDLFALEMATGLLFWARPGPWFLEKARPGLARPVKYICSAASSGFRLGGGTS